MSLNRSLKTAAALALGACASSGGGSSGSVEPLTFAPVLGINLAEMTRRPSGLYVRDITVGVGDPAISGDRVRLEYTLWLANGTRMEGVGPGEAPIEFQLGQRAVIAGWEEGVTGMRRGGRRRIVVPPALGYGIRPHGNIPGRSVLVFEMHLVYIGR